MSVPCPAEGMVAMQWHRIIFKPLLLTVRGSNNFQLWRMHLKDICWKVDWLFPILTRGFLETEAEPRELSAEFIFCCLGFQHDGPSPALAFLPVRFYCGSVTELGSCCAWPFPRRGSFSQVKPESQHHRCHSSACSLIVCLVTTKIWSDGH